MQMSDKVYKYKIVSWIAGILGVFALITGIGALLATATYIDNGTGESTGVRLIGPAMQTVFATLMIAGSVLMYKKHSAGKRLLLVVISVLLGLVVIDAALYFRKGQDYTYILSSLMLQVVPLAVLLFAIKSVSIKKKVADSFLEKPHR